MDLLGDDYEMAKTIDPNYINETDEDAIENNTLNTRMAMVKRGQGYPGRGYVRPTGGFIGATALSAAVIVPLIKETVGAIIRKIKQRRGKEGSGIIGNPKMNMVLHNLEKQLAYNINNKKYASGGSLIRNIIQRLKSGAKAVGSISGNIGKQMLLKSLDNYVDNKFGKGLYGTKQCYKQVMQGKTGGTLIQGGRIKFGHLLHPIFRNHLKIATRGYGLSNQTLDDITNEVMDNDPDMDEEVTYESLASGGSFFSTLAHKAKNAFKGAAKSNVVKNIGSQLKDTGKQMLSQTIDQYGDQLVDRVTNSKYGKQFDEYTGLNTNAIGKQIKNNTKQTLNDYIDRGYDRGLNYVQNFDEDEYEEQVALPPSRNNYENNYNDYNDYNDYETPNVNKPKPKPKPKPNDNIIFDKYSGRYIDTRTGTDAVMGKGLGRKKKQWVLKLGTM